MSIHSRPHPALPIQPRLSRPALLTTAGVLLLVVGAVVAGFMINGASYLGMAAIIGGSGLALFFLGLEPRRTFLVALAALLVGYALMGRGLAYVGLGNIYVGEMVLALALVRLFTIFWTARLQFLDWLLLAFMAWGLLRLVPYVGIYNMDALRDSAIWAYGFFALALSLTLERHHYEWLFRTLARWLPWLLVAWGVAYFVHWTIGPSLPSPPGSQLPIVSLKPGDAAVHLAGLSAFLLLGLYDRGRGDRSRGNLVMYAIFAVGTLALATTSRAALLSIALPLMLVFLFRPSIRWVQFAAAGLAVLAVLALFDVRISMTEEREFSARQITSNITSILDPDPGTDLEGTRQFREDWWAHIVDYTFRGELFWEGRGFGVNLADVDGFQVLADGSLRSPHNGHLNVLARMGVPGFVLWVSLLVFLGSGLLWARSHYLRRGDVVFAGLAAWVFVYWAAALINASFDVYLEGPQGGIWFWSLVGLGLGLIRLAMREDRQSSGPAGVFNAGEELRRPRLAGLQAPLETPRLGRNGR